MNSSILLRKLKSRLNKYKKIRKLNNVCKYYDLFIYDIEQEIEAYRKMVSVEIQINKLEAYACKVFNTDQHFMRTKTRQGNVPIIRHIVYTYMRSINISVVNCAKYYNQTHSMASHCKLRVRNRLECDKLTKHIIVDIYEKFNSFDRVCKMLEIKESHIKKWGL